MRDTLFFLQNELRDIELILLSFSLTVEKNTELLFELFHANHEIEKARVERKPLVEAYWKNVVKHIICGIGGTVKTDSEALSLLIRKEVSAAEELLARRLLSQRTPVDFHSRNPEIQAFEREVNGIRNELVPGGRKLEKISEAARRFTEQMGRDGALKTEVEKSKDPSMQMLSKLEELKKQQEKLREDAEDVVFGKLAQMLAPRSGSGLPQTPNSVTVPIRRDSNEDIRLIDQKRAAMQAATVGASP
jgi:hypothetical protein